MSKKLIEKLQKSKQLKVASSGLILKKDKESGISGTTSWRPASRNDMVKVLKVSSKSVSQSFSYDKDKGLWFAPNPEADNELLVSDSNGDWFIETVKLDLQGKLILPLRPKDFTRYLSMTEKKIRCSNQRTVIAFSIFFKHLSAKRKVSGSKAESRHYETVRYISKITHPNRAVSLV